MVVRLIIFLAINFGGLWIGGQFSSTGASSDWYMNLDKAPWTPPGWVFGAGWTSIMVCYSIYMALVWSKVKNRKQLLLLYLTQVVLNISWNPVFFYYHFTVAGLIIISLLTIVIVTKTLYYRSNMGLKSLLLAPYAIWLIIATSLNAYVVIFN